MKNNLIQLIENSRESSMKRRKTKKYKSRFAFLFLGLTLIASAIAYDFTILRPVHYLYYMCDQKAGDTGSCRFCHGAPIYPQERMDEDEELCPDPVSYDLGELRNTYLTYKSIFILLLFIGYLAFIKSSALGKKKWIDRMWAGMDPLMELERPTYKQDFRKFLLGKTLIGLILLLILFFMHNYFIPSIYISVYVGVPLLLIALALAIPAFGKNVDINFRKNLLVREDRRNTMLQNYRNSVFSLPVIKSLQHFEFKRRDFFEQWVRAKSHPLAIVENMVYTTHHFE